MATFAPPIGLSSRPRGHEFCKLGKRFHCQSILKIQFFKINMEIFPKINNISKALFMIATWPYLPRPKDWAAEAGVTDFTITVLV